MKKQRWAWCGMQLFFLAAAVIFQNRIFLCLIFLAGLSTLVTGFFNYLAIKKLQTELIVPLTGQKEKKNQGMLCLANPSLLYLPYITVSLQLRNQFTRACEELVLETSLFAKECRQLPIELSSMYCGVVEIEITKVCVWDIWRIVCCKRFHTGTGKICIYPHLFEQEIRFGDGMTDGMEQTKSQMYQPGYNPGEIFDIRAYQYGDEVRNIHWKLSGKLDQLMVMRQAQPFEKSVLLQFQNLCDGMEGMPELADMAAEIYFSISRNLLKQGICHEVAWLDRESRRYETHEIENEEDMIGILPHLLMQGFFGGAGKEELQHELPNKSYAHIVYVSCESANGTAWQGKWSGTWNTHLICTHGSSRRMQLENGVEQSVGLTDYMMQLRELSI